MTESTDAVVRRFLAAVQARDVDAVAATFRTDARYANVPRPPAVGRAAIRAVFTRILPRWGFSYVTLYDQDAGALEPLVAELTGR